MRYKIQISLPKVGITETQVIDCNGYDEACHLARDAAWDLYMAHEGTSEDLPSYDDRIMVNGLILLIANLNELLMICTLELYKII